MHATVVWSAARLARTAGAARLHAPALAALLGLPPRAAQGGRAAAPAAALAARAGRPALHAVMVRRQHGHRHRLRRREDSPVRALASRPMLARLRNPLTAVTQHGIVRRGAGTSFPGMEHVATAFFLLNIVLFVVFVVVTVARSSPSPGSSGACSTTRRSARLCPYWSAACCTPGSLCMEAARMHADRLLATLTCVRSCWCFSPLDIIACSCE